MQSIMLLFTTLGGHGFLNFPWVIFGQIDDFNGWWLTMTKEQHPWPCLATMESDGA